MLDDLQHACRRLVSRPGASALAVAMLALAVGLTTGMFTLLDALVLRPVPFRHPDTLVQLSVGGDHTRRNVVSPAVLRAW